VWKAEKFADPVIEERSGRDGGPDRTTVTLPLVSVDHALSAEGHEKGHEKGQRKSNAIDVRRAEICSIISQSSEITVSDIADKLGLSEKQVRGDIDFLRRGGYITREESTKKVNGLSLKYIRMIDNTDQLTGKDFL